MTAFPTSMLSDTTFRVINHEETTPLIFGKARNCSTFTSSAEPDTTEFRNDRVSDEYARVGSSDTTLRVIEHEETTLMTVKCSSTFTNSAGHACHARSATGITNATLRGSKHFVVQM